ncbi:hypothetical protein ElyMa_003040900 [Elysia marginata]|uniref:Uncharacterized protein n=1 Tax=Elysia marginata TaxID=1093978 RepID=A0AAV4IEB8_9GAST|nr:hypothetical protein ElyMa_003040900 [Elysia marginata]
MATSGSSDDAVKCTLREYKERTEKADAMKLTPFLKCMEACGLKQYKTTTETSIWNLHADTAKKCSIDQINSKVIPDIAADAVARKKGMKGRAPHDDPEVVKMVDDIKCKFAAKAGQAAHVSSLGLAGHRTTRFMLYATRYTVYTLGYITSQYHATCFIPCAILPETEGFCFIISEDEFFRRRRCFDFTFVTKEKKTKETKQSCTRRDKI